MNVGSLFAGIGGFELGLERAGFEIEWQVEVDPYCRAVLAQHFPEARRFEDVQEVGAEELGPVDLICGGFPCQDLSFAGKGAGIDGARSGLWAEFARLIRELRPGYVVVENVPGLLTGKGKRWDRAPIGRVLGDLDEMGYDAEWSVLSAREFGAPHLRKRVWIVAYPRVHVPDAERPRTAQLEIRRRRRQGWQPSDPPESALLRQEDGPGRPENAGAHRADLADADRLGRSKRDGELSSSRRQAKPGIAVGGRPLAGRPRGEADPWAAEPRVGRVAHGVPDRVERLAALGNALVPQIAEWIGRRILAYEAAAMSSGEIQPGVHPGVRPGVHPGVHRDPGESRRIARRGAVSGRPEKLRSPRHIEADS